MPTSSNNAAIKRNMRKRKARRQSKCFDADKKLPFEEAQHYADSLPDEALLMSRRSRAKGYDDFWWGERLVGRPPAIVEITKAGVQWLMLDDAEKAWLGEVESEPARQQVRREMVRNWNWTSWEDLLPINREFLLSLQWVPVDPYNAMEILARMAR